MDKEYNLQFFYLLFLINYTNIFNECDNVYYTNYSYEIAQIHYNHVTMWKLSFIVICKIDVVHPDKYIKQFTHELNKLVIENRI